MVIGGEGGIGEVGKIEGGIEGVKSGSPDLEMGSGCCNGCWEDGSREGGLFGEDCGVVSHGIFCAFGRKEDVGTSSCRLLHDPLCQHDVSDCSQ